MISCKRATRLASQALDVKLSLPERAALSLHLLACSYCRRFGAQIGFLRKTQRRSADD